MITDKFPRFEYRSPVEKLPENISHQDQTTVYLALDSQLQDIVDEMLDSVPLVSATRLLIEWNSGTTPLNGMSLKNKLDFCTGYKNIKENQGETYVEVQLNKPVIDRFGDDVSNLVMDGTMLSILKRIPHGEIYDNLQHVSANYSALKIQNT